jgi:hypothetical protein
LWSATIKSALTDYGRYFLEMTTTPYSFCLYPEKKANERKIEKNQIILEM